MPEPEHKKPIEFSFSKEFLAKINERRNLTTKKTSNQELSDDAPDPLDVIAFTFNLKQSTDEGSTDEDSDDADEDYDESKEKNLDIVQTKKDVERTSSIVFNKNGKEIFSLAAPGEGKFSKFKKFIAPTEEARVQPLLSKTIQSVILHGFNQGGFLSTGTALFNVFIPEVFEKTQKLPSLELAISSNSFQIIDSKKVILTQTEPIQDLLLDGEKGAPCKFTIETKTSIQSDKEGSYNIQIEEVKLIFEKADHAKRFQEFYGLNNPDPNGFSAFIASIVAGISHLISSIINFFKEIVNRNTAPVSLSNSTDSHDPLSLSKLTDSTDPLRLCNAIQVTKPSFSRHPIEPSSYQPLPSASPREGHPLFFQEEDVSKRSRFKQNSTNSTRKP